MTYFKHASHVSAAVGSWMHAVNIELKIFLKLWKANVFQFLCFLHTYKWYNMEGKEQKKGLCSAIIIY